MRTAADARRQHAILHTEPSIKKRVESVAAGVAGFWPTFYARIRREEFSETIETWKHAFERRLSPDAEARKRMSLSGLGDTSMTANQGDEAGMALIEQMRQGKVLPRIELVHAALLAMAREGRAKEIEAVIRSLPTDCTLPRYTALPCLVKLKPKEATVEILALAVSNAGNRGHALAILDRLTKWHDSTSTIHSTHNICRF